MHLREDPPDQATTIEAVPRRGSTEHIGRSHLGLRESHDGVTQRKLMPLEHICGVPMSAWRGANYLRPQWLWSSRAGQHNNARKQRGGRDKLSVRE